MDNKLTSIGINKHDHSKLKQYCNRNELSVVEFIRDSLNYFEKSGANPKTIETPTLQFSKMRERLDQVIRFMRTEEKGFLQEAMDKVSAIEIRLKSELNQIATRNDLQEISKNYIQQISKFNQIILKIDTSKDELTNAFSSEISRLSIKIVDIHESIKVLNEYIETKHLKIIREIEVQNVNSIKIIEEKIKDSKYSIINGIFILGSVLSVLIILLVYIIIHR